MTVEEHAMDIIAQLQDQANNIAYNAFNTVGSLQRDVPSARIAPNYPEPPIPPPEVLALKSEEPKTAAVSFVQAVKQFDALVAALPIHEGGAVKTAIESLRESGATSFVLDIRNNSGGLFRAGVEIAKMWLEKGVIVYITDSMGVRDIYKTDGEGAIATTEPLTVPVNKGTASASEILAGALKDNNRAETTFGKGRIQSIFQLSDGSGMAVTVARYETPAHINIDKVGITPDHPLPTGVLPMEEESFCNFLQDPSIPSAIPNLISR